MPASKQELLPQARALYAEGRTVEDVAAAVGVSAATIHRWKAADKKAGRSWDKLRQTWRSKDPTAFLAVIEGRLETLAAREDMDIGAWADSVQKVYNVLNKERERLGDISLTLGVLKSLAAYAVEHCSEDELGTVRHVIDDYLADLKRRHTF